ncbi:MAG TPA: PDZ domain-containing protein [Candidatus Hydrogenedentes bacterium]|nr:PDZ domain-containing protein [Candidatus Hydrogenedentota bacterium]
MLNSIILIAALSFGANDGFSQTLLAAAYDAVTPAIGLLEYSSEVTDPATGETSKRDGNALALLVSPDGLVMTHGHMVVENADPFNIRVTLGQGDNEKKYDAVLLKKPDDINVVFLKLKSETPLKLPYVKFSRPNGLMLGSEIALFGLLSESMDFNRAFQAGRIASILEKPRTTYCLDDNVRFGFVGGPVVDTQGRVVGVIGFDLSRQEGGDVYVRSGHPLIFQSELFQQYIDTPPKEKGDEKEEGDGWLGVFTQPLDDDFADYWGLEKNGGLIISTVIPGSPGAEAGLRTGDVIMDFNGTPIRAKLDREVVGFTKLVRETGPGKEVTIKLFRDKKPVDITMKLGTRPRTSQDAAEYEDTVFGLTVREITTDIRIALNLSDDVKGVIVRRVKSGSAAQLGKMRPGVIILNFGDHPVTNLDDFKAAVQKLAEQKPAEITVFARAGSVTGFFRLQPRWDAHE